MPAEKNRAQGPSARGCQSATVAHARQGGIRCGQGTVYCSNRRVSRSPALRKISSLLDGNEGKVPETYVFFRAISISRKGRAAGRVDCADCRTHTDFIDDYAVPKDGRRLA